MSYNFNGNTITRLARKGNITGHKTKEYLFDTKNKKYISSIYQKDNGIEFFEYEGIYYILADTGITRL